MHSWGPELVSFKFILLAGWLAGGKVKDKTEINNRSGDRWENDNEMGASPAVAAISGRGGMVGTTSLLRRCRIGPVD